MSLDDQLNPQYKYELTNEVLLAKPMNLANCKQVATPGVKKGLTDDIMDLPVTDELDMVNQVDERMP